VTLPAPDCTIQDMDIFHDNLVLYLQKNGTPLFCSINMPIDVDVQVCFLVFIICNIVCFSEIEPIYISYESA
jgi:hypothetical protein